MKNDARRSIEPLPKRKLLDLEGSWTSRRPSVDQPVQADIELMQSVCNWFRVVFTFQELEALQQRVAALEAENLVLSQSQSQPQTSADWNDIVQERDQLQAELALLHQSVCVCCLSLSYSSLSLARSGC